MLIMHLRIKSKQTFALALLLLKLVCLKDDSPCSSPPHSLPAFIITSFARKSARKNADTCTVQQHHRCWERCYFNNLLLLYTYTKFFLCNRHYSVPPYCSLSLHELQQQLSFLFFPDTDLRGIICFRRRRIRICLKQLFYTHIFL